MSFHSDDTIFALASGAGRAAIAVLRISGPATRSVIERVCGRVPEPRHATLLRFRSGDGETLDRGLVLWFPAPKSFTGEDSAEFHLHGGRAVVAGLLETLGHIDGVRLATAGEFTRRAYLNGRMDLTAVEGLADLIDAETRVQRRQALRQLDGPLGRLTEAWRRSILQASGLVEAAIDFADEGDVGEISIQRVQALLHPVADEIGALLVQDCTRGLRLRDGYTVVIAGPPNAGKSTLINALAQRDVAIVSPHAGTTRDAIEVHLDLGGLPVNLVDTAGLRTSPDPVEQEGVARARRHAERADLVLWLVAADDPSPSTCPGFGTPTMIIQTKLDHVHGSRVGAATDLAISALVGTGMDGLLAQLQSRAADGLAGSEAGLLTRQRHIECLTHARDALLRVLAPTREGEIELMAEELRIAARQLGRVAGRIDVEDILGEIFMRFCIGK